MLVLIGHYLIILVFLSFSPFIFRCLSYLLFSHQLMFIYSLSQVYVSFVSFSHRITPLSFYCSVGLVLVCSIRFGLSEKIIILDWQFCELKYSLLSVIIFHCEYIMSFSSRLLGSAKNLIRHWYISLYVTFFSFFLIAFNMFYRRCEHREIVQLVSLVHSWPGSVPSSSMHWAPSGVTIEHRARHKP